MKLFRSSLFIFFKEKTSLVLQLEIKIKRLESKKNLFIDGILVKITANVSGLGVSGGN